MLAGSGPDLVNVARSLTRLDQCWSLGPGDLVRFSLVGGRVGQCCPGCRPDLVNGGRPGRPTWPMLAWRRADLVNVARGPGPTWSMVAVGSGRLSRFFLRGGLTWSMLLAGPPDLVNVDRLGQCMGGGGGETSPPSVLSKSDATTPRRGLVSLGKVGGLGKREGFGESCSRSRCKS